MTVAELIKELRDRDPWLEVVVCCEDESGDFIDAPASSACVSLGRFFISGANDD